jgi:hypothetical protein
MFRALFALALIAAPAVALAANDVSVVNEVFAERSVAQADGKAKTVLVKVKSIPPGGKVVYVLSYRNLASRPLTGFFLTYPVPAAVVFDSAGQPGATVSVDGGKSFGSLATLKVAGADGKPRAARADDVTNVRWPTIVVPAGGSGKFSFRAIVK